MLAEITLFGGNYAPMNWAFCWGQLLAINEYTALFSLLGTMYGGDGRTTFALPDLRGRVVLGSGSGPGRTPRSIGQIGGYEQVTLGIQQMPAHNHESTAELTGEITSSLRCYNGQATTTSPRNAVLAQQESGVDPKAEVYERTQANADMDPSAISTQHTLAVNVAIQSAGGNTGHENMPPWQCLNYIIALQGYYPPRQ
ncbi:MAG: phage tail protein [Spirochaetales bacterium]|nr:phage tail protein [Spirochaetales bacterium]